MDPPAHFGYTFYVKEHLARGATAARPAYRLPKSWRGIKGSTFKKLCPQRDRLCALFHFIGHSVDTSRDFSVNDAIAQISSNKIAIAELWISVATTAGIFQRYDISGLEGRFRLSGERFSSVK